jgi:hypothetical protein
MDTNVSENEKEIILSSKPGADRFVCGKQMICPVLVANEMSGLAWPNAVFWSASIWTTRSAFITAPCPPQK